MKYNFDVVLNVEPYDVEVCTTFREAMKHWNLCVQYWLAVNIYKRFPSKKYRTMVTLIVSAVWHGVYTGYYACICGAPFYLAIEDVWVNIVLKGNKGKVRVFFINTFQTVYFLQFFLLQLLKLWEWIVSIFKMFGFSYLGIAFHLLTFDRIWYYYSSVYHAGYLLGLMLYLSGVFILKKKKVAEKRRAKNDSDHSDAHLKMQ